MLGWIAEATDMAQQSVEKLRRELDSVSGRQGRCFPRELKERVSAWIVERFAGGATATQLAAELGLASVTVSRWGKEAKQSSRALMPVEVVADTVIGGMVSVVSPSGRRTAPTIVDRGRASRAPYFHRDVPALPLAFFSISSRA